MNPGALPDFQLETLGTMVDGAESVWSMTLWVDFSPSPEELVKAVLQLLNSGWIRRVDIEPVRLTEEELLLDFHRKDSAKYWFAPSEAGLSAWLKHRDAK